MPATLPHSNVNARDAMVICLGIWSNAHVIMLIKHVSRRILVFVAAFFQGRLARYLDIAGCKDQLCDILNRLQEEHMHAIRGQVTSLDPPSGRPCSHGCVFGSGACGDGVKQSGHNRGAIYCPVAA